MSRGGRGGGIRATHADAMALGAECTACPLFIAGTRPVLGSGSVVATIAVVGDHPTFDEVGSGLAWTGKAGETLDALMSAEGPGRVALYLDNAVACAPPEGDLRVFALKTRKTMRAENRIKSYRSPVDCCRPRLFKALGVRRCGRCLKWESGPIALTCTCGKAATWQPQAALQRTPKVVQAAGNAALESLLGVTGIQKWRGSPVNMETRVQQALAVAVAEKPTVRLAELARKKAMLKKAGKGKRVRKKLKFNPKET